MSNLLGIFIRNKTKSKKSTKELKKAIALRDFKIHSPIGKDNIVYCLQVMKGMAYPIRSTVNGDFVIEIGVAPNGVVTSLALDDERFVLR